MTRARGLLLLAALTAALAGCGGSNGGGSSSAAGTAPDTTPAKVRTVETSRVEVIKSSGRGTGFDPVAIYKREAPGVVTVISVFGNGNVLSQGGGGGEGGLGSGFVLNGNGDVATNAHVVTTGQGRSLRQARQVYVQFADGNQVPARIVGTDPDADVALLRISPAGLTLRPLPLGSSSNLVVGSPVVAIGSPFGEPQSLSVGVVSATNRSIESLTQFSISGAIQTDAAINHGNSGGPLVDAQGRVIGINSQIRSTGGGGEGVGFAVPVNVVKRSIDQLGRSGRVRYAYLGTSTVALYPQLAEHFKLPVQRGAWVQDLVAGGPAAKAGLRAGKGKAQFQAAAYVPGGDIITKVDGRPLRRDADLSLAIADKRPGEQVRLEIWRGGKRRIVTVTLGARPSSTPQAR